MSLQDNRIDYKDNMREVVDKMNSILDEIINAVGQYPSLKEYIEGLTGGLKGTITTSPEGALVIHDFDSMEYQVVVTADDNVTVWRDKGPNSVTIYASETASVDYAIMSTTDALRLIRDNTDTVQEVVEARHGYPSLREYLDYLAARTPDTVTIKRHVVKAYQDQTVFNLPIGETYVKGTNTITVYVGGIKQRSNLDFNELSSTQIRFNDPLKVDWSVEIIWYDFTPTSISSHNARHGLGGGDEIELHGSQITDDTIPDSALKEKYVKHILSPTIPTTGEWEVGDLVHKSNPVAGGYVGWICITAGEYGTWNPEPVFKPFGLISN